MSNDLIQKMADTRLQQALSDYEDVLRDLLHQRMCHILSVDVEGEPDISWLTTADGMEQIRRMAWCSQKVVFAETCVKIYREACTKILVNVPTQDLEKNLHQFNDFVHSTVDEGLTRCDRSPLANLMGLIILLLTATLAVLYFPFMDYFFRHLKVIDELNHLKTVLTNQNTVNWYHFVNQKITELRHQEANHELQHPPQTNPEDQAMPDTNFEATL